jgi:hypothetical protein
VRESKHRKKVKEAKEQQGRAQTAGGLGQKRMKLRSKAGEVHGANNAGGRGHTRAE